MKKGDKVICIDDKLANSTTRDLTLGKIYTIFNFGMSRSRKIIYIIDDSGTNYGYYANRFITLSEQRRLKLEKLKNGSNL